MQTRANGLVWFAAALAGTAAYFIFSISTRATVGSAGAPALQLGATETEGRIRLSWNAQDEQVKRSTAATLEVHDGSRYEIYPINGDALRQGSLDYVQQSGDVLFTLTLFEDKTRGSKGMLRAISALPPEPRLLAPANTQRSRMTGKKSKAPSHRRHTRKSRR